MTISGTDPRDRNGKELTDPVLHAKYLDYCSARVADVLLRLTADEMYVLAQEVSAQPAESGERFPSFTTIVRLATERISRELALPDYPAWAREYQKDPAAFERQMLGLWEADVSTSDQGAN